MSDEMELEQEYTSELGDISDEKLAELSTFLVSELRMALDDEERVGMVEAWNEWRRQREAVPKQKTKNTPWEGASNVVVPLTLANTNGMYAKIKSYMQARKPTVMGKSFNKKHQLMADVAADLLNFLNNSPFHVNLPGKESTMLYDWISMGNQIMEWEWVERKVRIRRDGTFVEKVLKRGPELNLYPLEDVLVRGSAGEDVQNLPWIGFLRRYYGHEIKALGTQGFFDSDQVEVLIGQPMNEAKSDNDQAMYERQGLSPRYESNNDLGSLYDVVKVYVWFDGDDDGNLEDLIVHIQPDSGLILRVDYNPIGARLITNGKYLPVPGRFYATGVGKMSHDMQEEVDTFHNLRVNTQHMSASGGVIRRKGAAVFNKGKQVKPGFEFEADDPRADYVQWQFGDVTMSTLTGENQARAYVETAIGAADSFFGRPNTSAKSGTSFSLENMHASRTDSIFSSIAESIVEGYNDMFQKELMLLLSYADQTREMFGDFYNPQEESAKLEALDQLLALDPEDIPGSIKFSVMTTDMARTDEAKRQNAMLKFQVYSMVFDKMTQLVPALSQGQMDPETTRLIMNGIVGYHDMLKETLELAGSTNVDDALMDVELYRTMASMMDTMSREQAEQMRVMNEQQRAMGPAGTQSLGSPQPGQADLAAPESGMEQAMVGVGPGPGPGPGMGQGQIG